MNLGLVGNQEAIIREDKICQIKYNSFRSPRITLTFKGLTIEALVDSGAGRSLISYNAFKVMPDEFVKLQPSTIKLVDVHGNPLEIHGKVELKVNFNNVEMPQDFIVTKGITEDIILGVDAIYKHGLVIHGKRKLVYIAKEEDETVAAITRKYNPSLKTKKQVKIPARTEAFIEVVRTVQRHEETEDTSFIFKAKSFPANVHVSDSLHNEKRHGIYHICIRNQSDQPFYLKRGEIVGNIEPLSNETGASILTIEEALQEASAAQNDPQRIQKHLFKLANFMKQKTTDLKPQKIYPIRPRRKKGRINKVKEAQSTDKETKAPTNINVPAQYLDQIQQLISKFPDVFAERVSQLGSTSLVQHYIDTGDSPPKASRAYQANPQKNKEINDIVQELLDCGHVSPSMSPWASPVLLVPKKCGGLRFCIDYRKLNAVTKKDAFPLPRISSILDRMNGKKFFSSLDLFSGFWQIKLDPRTKEKTAFILNDPPALYEWDVLSMGLANSPATFQRLMLQVLKPVLGKSAYCYLDDILVFSDTLEDHLQHITEVFELLRKAGLKLKLKKCEFLKNSVAYLGHIITPEGLLPDPAKIEKIANFPTPKSIQEVQCFLGISNYYRSFIKDYGKIALPLTTKLKKENAKNFFWTKEDQEAFEHLRTCLVSSPILSFPDFEKPFMIFCDASNTGLGVVLSQEQNGKEVVISYASRTLKGPEVRFSTTEKEALAVIYALKHYRHYLQFQKEPIKIMSDHKPLVWLAAQKDDTSRLGRWAMLLAATNYQIVYKPGKKHGNADALSRLPVRQDKKSNPELTSKSCEEHQDTLDAKQSSLESLAEIPVNIVTEDGNNIENMVKCQENDDLCQQIRRYMRDGELNVENTIKPATWVKQIELFQEKNGLLYRETQAPQRNHKYLQLVAPYSIRKRILHIFHNSVTGGHFAYQRTYLKISAKFYWPNMREEIHEYCKACIDCTANRAPGPKAFLKPLELATRPNQVIGVDFLGPIKPMSPQGNKFIMVMTDKFSKFVRIAALPDLKAETAAKALMEEHVFNEGPPVAIVSDKGVQFTSALFRELCQLLGIKQNMSTSYHPETDGATERMNRTMVGVLRKMLREKNHENWEKLLGCFKMAYNDSVHSSTLQTPYYLEHGRDMNSIVNTALQLETDPNDIPNDYISELTERLRYAYHKTREAIKKARTRQKTDYDKRATEMKFQVGDKVLLDIRVIKDGECKKLTSKYTGPFRIIRVYNNMTVDISDNTYRPQRVHVNRLKPLFETMLWRDEPTTILQPTTNAELQFHKNVATQTLAQNPGKPLQEPHKQTANNKGLIGFQQGDLISWDNDVLEIPAIPKEVSKKVTLKPPRKPAKRGRGRPRKHPLGLQTHSSFKKNTKKLKLGKRMHFLNLTKEERQFYKRTANKTRETRQVKKHQKMTETKQTTNKKGAETRKTKELTRHKVGRPKGNPVKITAPVGGDLRPPPAGPERRAGLRPRHVLRKPKP